VSIVAWRDAKMIRTKQGSLPAVVACALILMMIFGVSLTPFVESGEREYVSEAHRAVNEMVNLSHLDYLRDEIVRSDGTVIPIWWVYCEPSVPGDRSSKYKYVEAASEGVSCVDDVARAALAYLAEYERSGDKHALNMARDCFKFIEYMRTPEGHFYNFILESGARNLKGATSEKGVNWWTTRGMWALARGIRVFDKVDPEYATHLEELIAPSLESIWEFLTAHELSKYGEYKTLHGARIPAWLVEDGSDASGVLVLALCELYEARPSPQTAEMAKMLADGIAGFQMGAPDEFPFGAHIPWGQALCNWHGWGSHQIKALAMAGRVFGNEAWIESAEFAANSFVTHMLASIGMFAHMGPAPLTYVQLSYGAQTITTGLLELYRATGKEIYAVLGGISGSWYTGNNVAGYPMYDAATGRGWDGIDPPGPERGIGVSFNSGAESTIEAVTTMIELASVPKACEYMDLGNRWKYAYRVVEAESFEKPVSGRPRKMWAQWTGENTPSGEFYVTARSGDSFKLDFTIPENDIYIPYAVFERQPLAGGQVGMSFSIDGQEPIVVDMGGSPDTKYFVMEKLAPWIELEAGRHSVTVKFSGAGKTQAAALDALVFQPMIEYRHMTAPDYRNVIIARSFADKASGKAIDVDIRCSAPGPEIVFGVKRYNTAGDLVSAEDVICPVPEGAETVQLDLPVEAFGYTLVEWR
jgi:hypothetical protein